MSMLRRVLGKAALAILLSLFVGWTDAGIVRADLSLGENGNSVGVVLIGSEEMTCRTSLCLSIPVLDLECPFCCSTWLVHPALDVVRRLRCYAFSPNSACTMGFWRV